MTFYFKSLLITNDYSYAENLERTEKQKVRINLFFYYPLDNQYQSFQSFQE